MPGPVVTPGLPGEHLGDQPVNLVSSRAEAVAGVLQPGRGDVQDREVAEAAIEQRLGEGDVPPPGLDQGING